MKHLQLIFSIVLIISAIALFNYSANHDSLDLTFLLRNSNNTIVSTPQQPTTDNTTLWAQY